MADIKLPAWLNNDSVNRLKSLFGNWWDKAATWVQWPMTQLNEYVCVQPVLGLLAWERHVTPIPGETEEMFRARVKHAVANAEDAGSAAGLKRIFYRLGIKIIDIQERVPDQDWDIVDINMEDDEVSRQQAVVAQLIKEYGRPCRRYQTSTSHVAEQTELPFTASFASQHEYHEDIAQTDKTNDCDVVVSEFSASFSSRYVHHIDTVATSKTNESEVTLIPFDTSFNFQMWTNSL